MVRTAWLLRSCADAGCTIGCCQDAEWDRWIFAALAAMLPLQGRSRQGAVVCPDLCKVSICHMLDNAQGVAAPFYSYRTSCNVPSCANSMYMRTW